MFLSPAIWILILLHFWEIFQLVPSISWVLGPGQHLWNQVCIFLNGFPRHVNSVCLPFQIGSQTLSRQSDNRPRRKLTPKLLADSSVKKQTCQQAIDPRSDTEKSKGDWTPKLTPNVQPLSWLFNADSRVSLYFALIGRSFSKTFHECNETGDRQKTQMWKDLNRFLFFTIPNYPHIIPAVSEAFLSTNCFPFSAEHVSQDINQMFWEQQKYKLPTMQTDFNSANYTNTEGLNLFLLSVCRFLHAWTRISTQLCAFFELHS